MIKLENYEVMGWEHAIRGMRNPMNSWDRSDSTFDEEGIAWIGDNDRELMSTMHKIADKEFTLDDFSHEHLTKSAETVLKNVIFSLNAHRELYLLNKDKTYWWQMIQLIPSSYNQKRTVMLNYEVLANIYEYRRNHKLDEWRDFCKWIETLPYSEIITCGVKEA